MAPAKRPVRVDSGCWSRNLRTNNFPDSDSDSDDSSPAGRDSGLDSSTGPSSDRPPPISEDARLIKELDLSGRHDEAVFKPNPWTIAKVNAAARPQTAAVKPAQSAPSTALKRSTGRLEVAFQNQSLRPKDLTATSALKPLTAFERSSTRADITPVPRKGLEKAAGPRSLVGRPFKRRQCTPAVASGSIKTASSPAYMHHKPASPPYSALALEYPTSKRANLPESAHLTPPLSNRSQSVAFISHASLPLASRGGFVHPQAIDPAASSYAQVYHHPGTAQWASDIEGYL
ncbi:hypothetical protein PHLGIDRAFT_121857 [Phlebiopsis gigantea 11061_1 CR5-6]|uniref:Uncharacterized protein n=1 Tax=Phlebiopsis gigantea (strain 11061_1 CR5-6) TaxID=745531 RepID=A0A0C3NEQ0_PHLG1|nr:hypothetical protein PHLGIDRAFT_121857 [Phlebiopsis gigantea 11061_1 CR5-6]